MQQTLPAWALQRVATLLSAQERTEKKSASAEDMARRAGLSKSLTRRCIKQIKRNSD